MSSSTDTDELSTEEILKSYREFLEGTLQEQLRLLIEQKESLQTDIYSYNELIETDLSTLTNSSASNLGKSKDTSNSNGSNSKWTHIGNNVHMQVKTSPEINMNEIFIDIGLGFRVPVPTKDAPALCRQMIDILSRKAAFCQGKIDFVVADIEQILMVMKELEESTRKK